MAELKICPMCAEQIPADAVFCPYCGTQFGEEVRAAPPPAAPAVVVSPPAAPVNVPPSSPPVRKNRAGLWIAGVLALVIILGVIGALLWTQHANIPVISALISTTTPTATVTPPPTFTPTKVSTYTPRPTATATPLPAWVTDFAQPILDTIANRPPNFQDDFGPGAAGWQFQNFYGRTIEYVNGELVMTNSDVWRNNIDYSDFVIEFDARFLPGVTNDSKWCFKFRNIEGSANYHWICIDYGGDVMMGFNSSWNGAIPINFPQAANPGNRSNHILVIGKDSRIAVFINGHPVFNIEARVPLLGNFLFRAYGTILAIDNIKIWNIYDLP